MNKKGFIATSLIYSFFLIFITLFLTIIADYLQNKVLLNTIESGIKKEINSTIGIQDFKIGDVLSFQDDNGSLNNLDVFPNDIDKNGNTGYKIINITYKVFGDNLSKDSIVVEQVDDTTKQFTIIITNRLIKNIDDLGNITIMGVQS